MADEVAKKDFDALVKKVNNKFAEIDKWQKAEEGYRKNIFDTTNEAIKTLNENDDALGKKIDQLRTDLQNTIDSINRSIKQLNDNNVAQDQRLAKLEKSKMVIDS